MWGSTSETLHLPSRAMSSRRLCPENRQLDVACTLVASRLDGRLSTEALR